MLLKKDGFIYIAWKGGILVRRGREPVLRIGNVNLLFSLVLQTSFVNSVSQSLRNAFLN